MMLEKFTHIGKNIIGEKFLFTISKHGPLLQNFRVPLMQIGILKHHMA